MHNELLHIGPLTVYGYGFMIAMGVLAAWFVAEQRARKLKLACEHIFYLVVWCTIGGFTSAKILFWITNWREFSKLIGFLVVSLVAVGLVFNADGVKDILLELFNKIIGA